MYRGSLDQKGDMDRERLGGLASLGSIVSRFENGPIPSLEYLDYELIPEVEELEQDFVISNPLSTAAHIGDDGEDTTPSKKRTRQNPLAEQIGSAVSVPVSEQVARKQAPIKEINRSAAVTGEASTVGNDMSEAESEDANSSYESDNEIAATRKGSGKPTSGRGAKPASSSNAIKIRRFINGIQHEMSTRVLERVTTIFEVLLFHCNMTLACTN